MKSTILAVFVASALLLTAMSCKKTSTGPTPQPDECGANTATWDTVSAILQTECRFCHTTGSNLGGVSLDTYDDVVALSKSGLLHRSIERDEGVSAMPPIRALDSCSTVVINVWRDNGYPW